MTSVYTMLKDLTEFMERNNVKLNHANEIVNGEYNISLTWKPTEHDGSVCKKLPLDDIEEHHIDKKYLQVNDKMPLHDTPMSVELEAPEKPTPVPTVTTVVGSPCVETGSSSDNKEEEIEAWKKLGAKEEPVEAIIMSPVEITSSSPIEEGDHVIYHGKIKEYQGKKAHVDKVADKCYVLRFLDSDMVIHANKDLVTKVVY